MIKTTLNVKRPKIISKDKNQNMSRRFGNNSRRGGRGSRGSRKVTHLITTKTNLKDKEDSRRLLFNVGSNKQVSDHEITTKYILNHVMIFF